MAETRYKRGRASEYKAMHELEADGYTVARMSGSHGTFDLIAWTEFEIRFIQIKSWSTSRKPTYRVERAAIALAKIPTNSSAELWARKHGQEGWDLREIIQKAH